MNTIQVASIRKFIIDNKTTPFSWGEFDCCIVAAKIIEILTGKDVYEPYRGKYKTQAGSVKIQKKLGTAQDVMNKHFSQIKTFNTMRGDIVELESGVMGFKFGLYIYAPTTTGLKPVRGKIAKSWRIE